MTFKEFMERNENLYDIIYVFNEDGEEIEGNIDDNSIVKEIVPARDEYGNESAANVNVIIANP